MRNNAESVLLHDLDKVWDLDVIKGVEGWCIGLGDPEKGIGTRIAGPKPWGGGQTLKSFKVTKRQILEALGMITSDGKITPRS